MKRTMHMWCSVILLLPFIQSAPPVQQEAVYDYDADEIFEGMLFKQHFEQRKKEAAADQVSTNTYILLQPVITEIRRNG